MLSSNSSKKRTKQFDHSTVRQTDRIRSFVFWKNRRLEKTLRLCLTFRLTSIAKVDSKFIISLLSRFRLLYLPTIVLFSLTKLYWLKSEKQVDVNSKYRLSIISFFSLVCLLMSYVSYLTNLNWFKTLIRLPSIANIRNSQICLWPCTRHAPTPARTLSISGLKSRVLKLPFLS